MATPPQELDAVADILSRWRTVNGPVERVRVVTETARLLRDLSDVSGRALAQGLAEHGAPGAAEQVARYTGVEASSDAVMDVAQALLALDRAELGRFAAELSDPGQQQRLLSAGAAALGGGAATVGATGLAPPDPGARSGHLPPPAQPNPAADGPPRAPQPPREPEPAPVVQPEPASDPAPAPAARPAEPAAPAAEPSPSPAIQRASATAQQRLSATAQQLDEARAARTVPAPGEQAGAAVARRRSTDGHYVRQAEHPLAAAVAAAGDARERLGAVVRVEDLPLSAAHLQEVLAATPDGWQRRTVLRRLVAGGAVTEVDAPGVVASFGQRGDRFAAAALLTRAGLTEVATVAPLVDARDVGRLERRAGG